MALVDFSKYTYSPILTLRPAEMQALEELPANDKDKIIPNVVLRPWVNSHYLESSIVRLDSAYGSRPRIVNITDDDLSGDRPVFTEIENLRDPEDGYAQWCDFIEAHETYIPTLQIEVPSEIKKQAQTLSMLGRGLVLHFNEYTIPSAAGIVAAASDWFDDSEMLIVLDYQQAKKELLTKAAGTIKLINDLKIIAPGAFYSPAATTFPNNFVNVGKQEIYERKFFEVVASSIDPEALIYCDHASARYEKQKGGSGGPAPRIDNACQYHWDFFRVSGEDDREKAYAEAAEKACTSDDWVDLGIWGTQQILATASGIPAISSAKMCTGVRINIHMHVQSGASTLPPEEPWSDF